MDVLTNKSTKEYQYTSRYAQFPYYYHSVDDKYIYGITSNLNTDVSIVLHTVAPIDTLESLALKYYGRPDLYWVIADINKIRDCFEPLFGKFTSIKIPSLSEISFK